MLGLVPFTLLFRPSAAHICGSTGSTVLLDAEASDGDPRRRFTGECAEITPYIVGSFPYVCGSYSNVEVVSFLYGVVHTPPLM